jgi:spore germination cell wall hydrolase CwlJ-like protein
MKLLVTIFLILIPLTSMESPLPSRIASPVEIKYGTVKSGIDKELICLAQAIYFEGRSLPDKSQALIAKVVLNRVESRGFPNSICGVVYQPSKNPALPRRCQFSFTCDGKPETIHEHLAWDKAMIIAHKATQGHYNGLTKATHYTRCNRKIDWQNNMKMVTSDGAHCFYK